MTVNTSTVRKLICTSGVILTTVLSVGCGDDGPEGKEFYNDFCATSCHGIDNLGTTGSEGGEPVGPINNSDTQSIKNAIFNVTQMNIPDLNSLRDGEITVIAAYIPTIKVNPKEIYDQFCATSCHGLDNTGTIITGVGSINVPTTVQAIKDAIVNVFEMDIDNSPELSKLSDTKIKVIADYIPLIP